MKSLSSLFGWVLLVAVLAVPSFLFYNWWTKSKQQSSAELAQAPAPANIFPVAEKTAAPAQVLLSTPAAQPASLPLKPAANSAVQDAPGPVVRPVSAAAVSTAAAAGAAASTGTVQGVAGSTQTAKASYFNPKGDRDPTLSPEDYRRIKEAEMQRREEDNRIKREEYKAQKKDSCESRLKLQGIVGKAVIINGDMYYMGQTIYGAKILKVGPDYIIGECKGKKFKKGL